MITSNLLNEKENILGSKLMPVRYINTLQIGKKFILLNLNHNHISSQSNPFDHNKDYKVIQILSVTPKINRTKIDNTLTYDRTTNRDVSFDNKDIKNPDAFNFRKYLYSSSFTFMNKCLHNGWLYCEVEYMDVYTKEVKTDFICGKYDLYFESNRKEPFSPYHSDDKECCDYLFISSAFEYDLMPQNKKDKRQQAFYDLIEDETITESAKAIIENEFHDILIRNFKYFLAKTILSDRGTINDKDTIEIDGLTWYNGFHNNVHGVYGRNYLFYDYIPNGWRLPTVKEFKSMFEKHPMLRKQLIEDIEKKGIKAFRNNVGLECHYYEYQITRNHCNVMINDSNDYSNEKCYFPSRLKTFCMKSNELSYMNPCIDSFNNGYKNYYIMLVKMSDEEIKKQEEWANNVLSELSLYETIDSIYKQFGVKNIDDIDSITFDVKIDDKIKTYERCKDNKNIDLLKEAIAKYIGNNDVYNAKNIDISFSDDNGNHGALNYDSHKHSNMRKFLTNISPLLCRSLCIYDINSIERLTYTSDYYSSRICDIREAYDKMCMPVDMYFYIKDTLSEIGINHKELLLKKVDASSYYNYSHKEYNTCAVTAYINKLVLHMSDGKDITINELPIEYFNQSILYKNILSDDSQYSDDIKEFMKDISKKLNKDKNDND